MTTTTSTGSSSSEAARDALDHDDNDDHDDDNEQDNNLHQELSSRTLPSEMCTTNTAAAVIIPANNNNNDDDNNNPPSKRDKIGLLEALAIQPNVHNQLNFESWYGLHSPCCRIFVWIVLFCILIAGSYSISFLTVRRHKELQQLGDWNAACWNDICALSRLLPDCILLGNSNTDASKEYNIVDDHDDVDGYFITDFENYHGPLDIAFPESCQTAYQKGFHMLVSDDDMQKKKTTQIHASKQQEEDPDHDDDKQKEKEDLMAAAMFDSKFPSILFHLNSPFRHQQQQQQQHTQAEKSEAAVTVDVNCRVSFYWLDDEDNDPLLSPQFTTTGQHLINHVELRQIMCDHVVPSLLHSQRLWLQSYYGLFTTIFFASFVVRSFMIGMKLLFGYVWPLMQLSILLGVLFIWPKTNVSGKQIGFGTIFWNLLLLSLVNLGYSFGMDDTTTISIHVALITVCISLSMWVYNDSNAAQGWLSLALLWHGLSFVEPYLDQARLVLLKQSSLLHYLDWAMSTLGRWCIPGSNGWQRLVFLVIVWRCYPYQKEAKERVLRWLGF